MTQRTLSKSHDLLCINRVQRKAGGGEQSRDLARTDGRRVRPRDDQHAEKPECGRGDARAGKLFGQQDRREKGDPDRVGEFEGCELGEGDGGEGVEPEVLAGVVEEVASDVQRGVGGADLGEASAAAGDEGGNDEPADCRSVKHQLERIHFAQNFTA